MYVITGATGNTGRIVAERLLAEKKPVRVLGRSIARLRNLAIAGADPVACDLSDASALSRAFRGARAVYLMIPPDLGSPDYRRQQDHMSEAMFTALKNTGVKYAVTLSSIGAEQQNGTGSILGLHHLEQMLNDIEDLNVLHLRPGYFMENSLAQTAIIPQMKSAGGPLDADLRLPMVATRDVGRAAATALLKLDFQGPGTRELHGERDLSMREATMIIGHAIAKPDLEYKQLPDHTVRGALATTGWSPNVIDLVLEMARGFNSAHIAAREKRSPQTTTPTSFEAFVAEVFVPVYHGRETVAA